MIELQSKDIDLILLELTKVKKELKPLEKNTKNAYLGNDYADLKEILTTLAPTNKNLSITVQQFVIETIQGLENAIMTTVTHRASNQFIRSVSTLGHDGIKSQAIGSAITYMRRYHLQSMFNLEADPITDDDGNMSSNITHKEEKFIFKKFDENGKEHSTFNKFTTYYKSILPMLENISIANDSLDSKFENYKIANKTHINNIIKWAENFDKSNKKHAKNIIDKCCKLLVIMNEHGNSERIKKIQQVKKLENKLNNRQNGG